MALRKVYDAHGQTYYVEVTELAPDGQGRVGNRQVVEVGNTITVEEGTGLVPLAYDYVANTYVAAGNGAGEVETVVYKTGGAGGTTVATLTLTYDANDKLLTVTRS